MAFSLRKWYDKKKICRSGGFGMIYRKLGNTGIEVSEVGLGGENVTKSSYEITKGIVDVMDEGGMNIIDAFMPQPEVRSHFGKALV